MPETPILLKVLLARTTGSSTPRSARVRQRPQQRTTATWRAPTPAGRNCPAGYQGRSGACPTPITAGCWKRCSPAGPPGSFSAPPRSAHHPRQARTASTSELACPLSHSPIGIRPFIERRSAKSMSPSTSRILRRDTARRTQEPLDMIRMGTPNLLPGHPVLLPDTTRHGAALPH